MSIYKFSDGTKQSVTDFIYNLQWRCLLYAKEYIARSSHWEPNHEGNGDRAVERRTVNRGDSGSIPPTVISKLRQFRSPHIYLCLSEDTLKAGGPFYLVSMLGEVKDPTQGVNV